MAKERPGRRVGKRSLEESMNSLKLKMTEEELQTEVMKLVADSGWLHHELADWMYRMARYRMKSSVRKGRRWPLAGWPDLILLQRFDDDRGPRRMIVMELKSSTGVVRDVQREFLKSFALIPACEVYVIRPKDFHSGDVEYILTKGPIPDHEGTVKELGKPFGKKWEPLTGVKIPYEDD